MPSFFKSGKRSLQLLEPIHSEVPDLKEAELSAIYYGQRMAGDFYDFLRVSPNRVVFGLLDVAGRHQQTRSIAATVQQAFREAAPRLFETQEVNEAHAMIELCLLMNRAILGAVDGGVLSCPALAACFNEDIGTVCYFNAGHTPALLRHNGGVTELCATGLPLGLFSHVTCDASTVAVEARGAFVMLSRGMVEASCKGDDYGLLRAKQALATSTAVTAKEICVVMLDDVRGFMGTPPTHNDVTVLALSRNGSA